MFVKQLLLGDSIERFAKEVYGSSPYAKPGGAAHLHVFGGWPDLDLIAAESKSQIKIIKDFKIIHSDSFFEAGALENFFESGHSIVIRHAELSHPRLFRLAEDFASNLQPQAVDIQIFVTPAGHQTFGWHYDPEEVFIIQTRGVKTYTLRKNTVNPHPTPSTMPVDLQYEKETSTTYMESTLHSGDWIYIPRGWWHKAVAQEGSVHLSIGLS